MNIFTDDPESLSPPCVDVSAAGKRLPMPPEVPAFFRRINADHVADAMGFEPEFRWAIRGEWS